MAGPTLTLRVDGASPARFEAAAARFPAHIRTEVAAALRTGAAAALRVVAAEVSGGRYHTDAGMRAGIKAGLRVVPVPGPIPGATVEATADHMPPGKGPMVAAWNKATWSHPVFGTDTQVEQHGHPYFTRSVDQVAPNVTRAVVAAMSKAAEQLAAESG